MARTIHSAPKSTVRDRAPRSFFDGRKPTVIPAHLHTASKAPRPDRSAFAPPAPPARKLASGPGLGKGAAAPARPPAPAPVPPAAPAPAPPDVRTAAAALALAALASKAALPPPARKDGPAHTHSEKKTENKERKLLLSFNDK